MCSFRKAIVKLRGLNSLFGQLGALVIVVLLVPHFAWFVLVKLERDELRSSYAVEETRFLIEAVDQHVQRGATDPLPWRLRTEPLGSPDVPVDDPAQSRRVAAFRDALKAKLPAGSEIRIAAPLKGQHEPQMWVMSPNQPNWVIIPVRQGPPPPRGDRMLVWLIISFSAAVLLALFAAWRLQRPIRNLAIAAARFGQGREVKPVQEEGPHEFRLLTRRFNGMVADISQNESDRGIMLAGVAHDLKAPLARLRLRAEMVDDGRQRDGFVRDVDSLTHIVDQFLVFAHDGADQSPRDPVNAQCERFARHYHGAWPDRAMLRLNLQADDSFLLSAATLDRLLSNLVDNAYHYGQPPVTISTGRRGKSWFLSVTDEGEGIPEAAIGTASRPFVRLDPARGGNAHCGLGLAIVERLATRAQGECLLSTGAAEKEPRDGSHAAAKDGQKDAVSDAAGLCVELRFPMLAG